MSPPGLCRRQSRAWVDNAVRLIEADARRSADTHLLRYPLPSKWSGDVDVALYLKDETTHITGSLKHRLARSLFLYALCNGWITEATTVVESGPPRQRRMPSLAKRSSSSPSRPPRRWPGPRTASAT